MIALLCLFSFTLGAMAMLAAGRRVSPKPVAAPHVTAAAVPSARTKPASKPCRHDYGEPDDAGLLACRDCGALQEPAR
jgi:hypothetical protein